MAGTVVEMEGGKARCAVGVQHQETGRGSRSVVEDVSRDLADQTRVINEGRAARRYHWPTPYRLQATGYGLRATGEEGTCGSAELGRYLLRWCSYVRAKRLWKDKRAGASAAVEEASAGTRASSERAPDEERLRD